MKFSESIMKNPKITAIIFDLSIPMLLYFCLQNDITWLAWCLMGLVVASRVLISVKN